jgi:uncharacterized damage-inducible protein DinB
MQAAILSDLIVSLEKSAAILTDFINSIPEGELKIKRRPGFWSVQHHVYHLADVQELLYRRLVKFNDEAKPVFAPFIPEKDDAKFAVYNSTAEALAGYQEIRRRQIDMLNSMDEERLYKKGSHPEYKTYTPMILIRHILFHDYWHMYRIEELWLTNDEYLVDE